MQGAGGVLALVLIEWTAGWIGAAAWSQSWKVVRRGHFRITAWVAVVVASLALLANRGALNSGEEAVLQGYAVLALLIAAGLYLASQYVGRDKPPVIAGVLAGVAGVAALVASAPLIDGWSDVAAAAGLLAGACLLGGVTNGMMLGHWYLNQPGLRTWALARLTNFTLVAVLLSGAAGIAAAGELTSASTEGAVLGIPGFGDSFATVFFVVWLCTLLFTGVIAWAARRCVRIRSIQSATGLFYVALLSGGVSEFLVRYLMVH